AYTKAPPVVMDPVMNWSGFYLGANIGVGWSQTNGWLVDATPPLANPIGTQSDGNGVGVVGGAQVGANWQIAPHFVLGVEGTFSGSSITDKSSQSTTLAPYPEGSYTDQNVHINWFATATARVGYNWNTSLVYVKGGAAWMNGEYTGRATVLGS